MSGYPLRVDLTGRRVLVVGGGPEAARRAASCARSGADVVVVAETVCEDLADVEHSGAVRLRRRDYRPDDLDRAWLAHAVTGDRSVDDAVAADAERRRIWCLRTDDPVTTARRRRRAGPGRVSLVGGGPGERGLLTVRAVELIAEADVIVVDRLAPHSVLAEVDPDVVVIDVGKTPAHHPVDQDEINRLLVEHARAGRWVVRLKGGDPFLLGRGGEEVLFCRNAGVEVEVVPGVTSAFAVPAAAGIPVTHRGLSRQVTVVSGHEESDWAALAAVGGTLVFLMGVGRLAQIATGLIGHGLVADTPAAIVERGFSRDQRTTCAPLQEIAALADGRQVRAPAVVVVGAVAEFAAGSTPDRAESVR